MTAKALRTKLVLNSQKGGADALRYIVAVVCKMYPQGKIYAAPCYKHFQEKSKNPSAIEQMVVLVAILEAIHENIEECKGLIEVLFLMEKPARKGLSSVGYMPAADLERLLDVKKDVKTSE
jgi:hypothetical protein